jgi:hypothetical protein
MKEETDRQRLGSDYLRGRRYRCSLDKIASQYLAPEDLTVHMGRRCSPYSRHVGTSQKHPLRTFPPEKISCSGAYRNSGSLGLLTIAWRPALVST